MASTLSLVWEMSAVLTREAVETVIGYMWAEKQVAIGAAATVNGGCEEMEV